MMGEFSNFFWSVIASTAGTTTLLGAAAFLFRSHISHWLSKDLETQKAQHQRDLESYKVSLIADTERSKAMQALKTAGAMKIIEKKYAAIERLHNSLIDYVADPLALAGMPIALSRATELAKINTAQVEYRAALKNAEIFIVLEDLEVLGKIGLEVSELFIKMAQATGPLAKDQIDRYADVLYPLSVHATGIIKKHIDAMLSMT